MEQQQAKKKNSVWAEIEPFCVLQIIIRNFWMVLMAAALAVLVTYVALTLTSRPVYSCSV